MRNRVEFRAEAAREFVEAFEWYESEILVTAVFHLKRNPQRWSDRVRERVFALEPMEAFV